MWFALTVKAAFIPRNQAPLNELVTFPDEGCFSPASPLLRRKRECPACAGPCLEGFPHQHRTGLELVVVAEVGHCPLNLLPGLACHVTTRLQRLEEWMARVAGDVSRIYWPLRGAFAPLVRCRSGKQR